MLIQSVLCPGNDASRIPQRLSRFIFSRWTGWTGVTWAHGQQRQTGTRIDNVVVGTIPLRQQLEETCEVVGANDRAMLCLEQCFQRLFG